MLARTSESVPNTPEHQSRVENCFQGLSCAAFELPYRSGLAAVAARLQAEHVQIRLSTVVLILSGNNRRNSHFTGS